MPYEYRKLSPQEREEIINYRRANGYPLHAPPHPFRGAGSYLITAANFEHRAVMSSPERRTEFEARLLNLIKEIAEDLIAWVVLPNHYHLLLGVRSFDDVSAALKHLHGTTSREWNLEDNLTGKRRVWYKFADTYLFADIVNFTPISARFAPHEVVDMLNGLFSHFDELVDKYDVEKIQVAGDGYMVAAGVPTPRVDHATVLARLALDMLEYVNREEFLGGRHIDIRIGLNSGSLIAGVIGRKKYFYALWGDMVNTASRMESHGESGKIQITRATYELVKDEFECEYIGEITVKGKGKMEAWHLLARKEERSLYHAGISYS